LHDALPISRADPERPGQRNDAMNRRQLLALSLFAVPVLLTAPSALLAAPAPAAAPVDPYQPVEVDIRPGFEVGSIVVVSKDFFLYHIIAPGKAIRYGIAVGKNELVWKGRAVIGRKTEWPSWHPTPEMIERNPAAYAKYADGMPGGPGNPPGARSLRSEERR